MTGSLQAKLTRRRDWLSIVTRLGPSIGLVLVWLLFAATVGADFVKWDNQRLMLLQTAVVATAAVGATLVIIAGGIDLSVGSMIALTTVVVALVLQSTGSAFAATGAGVAAGLLAGAAVGAMVIGHVGRVGAVVAGALVAVWSGQTVHPALALALGLGAAGLVGALNERAVRRIPLAPFIVTLGMWGGLRGLAKGLGDNQAVYPEQLGGLDRLMQVGGGSLLEILPLGVWIPIVLASIMAAVLRYTRFGRHVFAIGSNEQTARLAGVRIDRTKLLVFVVALGCAGLAGILQFSYLSMGDPTTADGYELKVIAAVVIGGASLSGGEGSISGTLFGALITTAVDNGCTQLGLDNWVQEIITGGIIVFAVALDRLRHRRAFAGLRAA